MEAPFAAAEVKNPDRSECPENTVASKPARDAYALTILATDRSVSRPERNLLALPIGRKIAPASIPAACSHAHRAFDRASYVTAGNRDDVAGAFLIGLAMADGD